MPEIDRIKDRIRKLLALAGSANEFEAASASAKAQELCDIYNLELSRMGEGGAGAGSAVESIEISPLKRNREGWEVWLLDDLGRVCECTTWINTLTRNGRKAGSKFMAVGYPADVALLGYLYPYLERTILRLYRKALAGEKMKYAPGAWGSRDTYRFKRGFAWGAIRRITQRLELARDDRRAEDSGIQALVLVKNRQVDEWTAANLDLKPGSFKHRCDISQNGYEAGKSAGEGINLNRPIGGNERKAVGGE